VKTAGPLDSLVRQIVREELRAMLAARGETTAREYTSRGPLPPATSARSFRREARAMLAAKGEGVRVEGTGPRDRVWFVAVEAWHRWRTVARTEGAPAESSDAELAGAALRGAGMRVLRGGRR
jgi:hypothetical protein